MIKTFLKASATLILMLGVGATSVFAVDSPVLISPAADEEIYATKPVFSWKADRAVEKYDLVINGELAETISGDQILSLVVNGNITYKLAEPKALEVGAAFTWVVVATAGAEQAISNVQNFRVKKLKPAVPIYPAPNDKDPIRVVAEKDIPFLTWEHVQSKDKLNYQVFFYDPAPGYDKEGKPIEVAWKELDPKTVNQATLEVQPKLDSKNIDKKKPYLWKVVTEKDGQRVESPEWSFFMIASLGLEGGVKFAGNISGIPKSEMKIKPRFGGGIFAMQQAYKYKQFAFHGQLDILVEEKASELSEDDGAQEQYRDLLLATDFLTFGLYARPEYYFSPKVRMYLQVGIDLSIVLRSRAIDPAQPDDIFAKVTKEYVPRFQAAFTAGLGASFKLPINFLFGRPLVLGIEVKYHEGLTPYVKKSFLLTEPFTTKGKLRLRGAEAAVTVNVISF